MDRVESEPDGGSRVLYDSIDADWFDRAEIDWLGNPELSQEAGEAVSVVEEERPRTDAWSGEEYEGAWFELEFSSGGREVSHYLNLFAAPLARTVAAATRVPGNKEDELIEKTSLNRLPDADVGEIEAALRRASSARSVAVYDVGQGSSSALLDDVPVLYFDVGGAALRDTRTFPETLSGFCTTVFPPVVLSHWDWDHWSSAHRDRSLLAMTWIVPRHDNQLGAVHAKFLGDLLLNGRVLVWPRNLPSITVDGATVVQCTGSARDRNNSGLALIFGSPPEADGRRMLLPGDAGYRNVPGSASEYSSIVVPHHGGRTPPGAVPPWDGNPAGRIVYSYGAGNSYWHPLADVGRDHASTWKRSLHTAMRGPHGLGHVHLHWDQGDPSAYIPCGGSECQLGCCQR